MGEQATAARLRLAEIRMRDPFILEADTGKFVLFGTTDGNVWGGPATGFDCYTSNDLKHWEGPIAAFRPPPGFWADTQFWAPEVYALDGRFFMLANFATSSGERPRGVSVLVADSPTGPFQPWSDGPVTPRNQPCLDGTLHIGDDGTSWLVYSRGTEGTAGEAGIRDGEMLRSASPRTCVRQLTSRSSFSGRPLRVGCGRSVSRRGRNRRRA